MIHWTFQVPIYEMRNDGRDNLLGALLIAGQFVIPEVRKWRSECRFLLFYVCNVVCNGYRSKIISKMYEKIKLKYPSKFTDHSQRF